MAAGFSSAFDVGWGTAELFAGVPNNIFTQPIMGATVPPLAGAIDETVVEPVSEVVGGAYTYAVEGASSITEGFGDAFQDTANAMKIVGILAIIVAGAYVIGKVR